MRSFLCMPTQSPPIDFLDNATFKAFIDALQNLFKSSEHLPLSEVRKLSVSFFLFPGTIYEPIENKVKWIKKIKEPIDTLCSK